MQEEIKKEIQKVLASLHIESGEISLEHPTEIFHGDYSTNIALALAKELKQIPRELAEKIVKELQKKLPPEIEKIEIAGAG